VGSSDPINAQRKLTLEEVVVLADVTEAGSLANNCCNWLVGCFVALAVEPLLLLMAVAAVVVVDGEDVAG
jgi:membrane protein YqaA with SNARE-associated domain